MAKLELETGEISMEVSTFSTTLLLKYNDYIQMK